MNNAKFLVYLNYFQVSAQTIKKLGGGVLLLCLRLFCSLTSRIKPANSGLDVSALMLCICADEEVTVTFLSEVSATEVPERSKQNNSCSFKVRFDSLSK